MTARPVCAVDLDDAILEPHAIRLKVGQHVTGSCDEKSNEFRVGFASTVFKNLLFEELRTVLDALTFLSGGIYGCVETAGVESIAADSTLLFKYENAKARF